MGVAILGSTAPGSFVPGGEALSAPAATSATAGGAAVGIVAHGAQGFMQPPPILRSTFLQPSINAQYPNITWTQAQFEAEFQWMTSAGIHEIILQWTVDQDANESYFPIGATTLPPYYNSMVATCLAAAAACGVTVWLGLCNTGNWQAHATDNTWLYNQYYLNTVAATQLVSLYSGQFVGWYISNETNDQLMAPGQDVSEQTAFFQDNTSWLHANTGLPVMTSPTFSYTWPTVNETPAQFAASCAAVLGTFDVINVQDGTGDHATNPMSSDLTAYFSALQAQFAGVPGVQVWQNCDMYDYATGTPDSAATLAANMAATHGYVSKYCSFSFETQMDPLTTSPAGNYSYYQAYRAYAKPYFDASDFTASPGTAEIGVAARVPSVGVKPTAGVATIGVAAASAAASVGVPAGTAVIGAGSLAKGPGVAPSAGVAEVGTVAHGLTGYVAMYAYPSTAQIGVAAIPPPVELGSTVVGVQVFNATVFAFAPAPERTYFVPFEPRTYVVPAESRKLTVFGEDRTSNIPYEDRIDVVPYEDRTDDA